MTNFNISITSDIVCPWCYIGHARLQRAIANHKTQHPTDTFTLVYKPYYLSPIPIDPASPSFPIKSESRREFYVRRFGGAARVDQMQTTLGRIAAQDGLSFKFGGNVGHSRNGHRLVWWAQQQQQQQQQLSTSAPTSSSSSSNKQREENEHDTLQNKVMLGLWKRYFEQEVDITKLDVLIEVGLEAGLGKSQSNSDSATTTAKEEQETAIRNFLLSPEGGVEVDRVANAERNKGITGVPFYTVQGKWDVEGAQESDAFETLFRKWKDIELKEGTKVGKADIETKLSCAVGENC